MQQTDVGLRQDSKAHVQVQARDFRAVLILNAPVAQGAGF
jgi:hypothetical protein